MSDSDKHAATNDLMTRVRSLEEKVSGFGEKISAAVLEVKTAIHAVIHEIDKDRIKKTEQESDWKIEHAMAVERCENKGKIAEEAKDLAKKALSEAAEAKIIAEKAKASANAKAQPSGHKATQVAAWGAGSAWIVKIIVDVIQSLKGNH